MQAIVRTAIHTFLNSSGKKKKKFIKKVKRRLQISALPLYLSRTVYVLGLHCKGSGFLFGCFLVFLVIKEKTTKNLRCCSICWAGCSRPELQCPLRGAARPLVCRRNQPPTQRGSDGAAGWSAQTVRDEKARQKYPNVFKEEEDVRTGLGIDCACSYLAEPRRK